MATNLFAPVQASSTNKPLVEFRAGKMNYNPSTKKVTPDKRKGLVQLVQSVDSLIHLMWKDRTTGVVARDDDLIIFPEDAVYKRVTQCTTGRVYLLEFKSSSKKLFFWMQEPKEDKDEEYVNKINQYINNPPSGTDSGFGMDQSAMLQMLSGMGGAGSAGTGSSSSSSSSSGTGAASSSSGTGTASSSAGANRAAAQQTGQQQRQSTPNIGMNDLQSILSGMGVPGSTVNSILQQHQRQQPQQSTATSGQPGTTQQAAQQPRVSLNQVMNPELLAPILNNPAVQSQLLPLLPEERRTPEELNQLLRSPQFLQSLDTFNSALQSGQLGDMLRQFGVDTGGAPGVDAFLNALQAQVQVRSQLPSPSNQQKDEKKDDKKDDKKDKEDKDKEGGDKMDTS